MRLIYSTLAVSVIAALLTSGAAKASSYKGQEVYKAEYKKIIQSKAPEIKSCYRELLKKKQIPNIEGQITFEIHVNQDGKVLTVTSVPDTSDFHNEKIEECVSEALMKAEFPKVNMKDKDGNRIPEVITEVYYPFVFKGK